MRTRHDRITRHFPEARASQDETVRYILPERVANYVSNGIEIGKATAYVAVVAASGCRLAERWYFDPDPNPIFFGIGASALYNLARLANGKGLSEHTPALFVGSVAGYSLVSLFY